MISHAFIQGHSFIHKKRTRIMWPTTKVKETVISHNPLQSVQHKYDVVMNIRRLPASTFSHETLYAPTHGPASPAPSHPPVGPEGGRGRGNPWANISCLSFSHTLLNHFTHSLPFTRLHHITLQTKTG
eukprot:GHVU01019255.1.p1 GENE.GHVU01019255.1~~GHVU01019255.1.p1  ORF type:complete len:128 (+),score=0.75 GHVU01019255.1:75-458(+)